MTEINTREIAAQLVRDHGPDVDASTIDEALLDDYSLDERTPDDQRDALVEEIHKLIQEHPWERQCRSWPNHP